MNYERVSKSFIAKLVAQKMHGMII